MEDAGGIKAMQNELQRVINLAKKTGDRVIVFDQNKPENTYVVMGLDEYEKLAIGKHEVRGLTEDGLLDKINRDIAIWKSENDFSFAGAQNEAKAEAKPEIIAQNKQIKKNSWKIPQNVKEAAEEIMEENRQYLDEVTF